MLALMTASRTAGARAAAPAAPAGLFRDSDFRRLWTADAVSQAGTAVTLLALPLVAIGTLHADAFQAGLLVAFEYLGFLLLGLPAGALVDRTRGRRVMIAGDLGRAALLGSVPAAAWLDALSLTQLYAAAFGLSVCTVFFDVAAQSQLPRLVEPDRLVEANVRIEAGRTLTQAAGPGAGGALVGVLTAPFAIVLDAVSYLASAALLARIRRPDAVPGAGDAVPGDAARGTARSLGDDIAEGLRFVLGNRLLRALTLGSALSNLFGTMGAAMLLVLLAGELGLSPFLCGLVFTAEAAGGFLGSLLTTRIARRLGQGPAMCAAVVTSGVLWLAAVPCFQSDWRLALAVALQGLGWTVPPAALPGADARAHDGNVPLRRVGRHARRSTGRCGPGATPGRPAGPVDRSPGRAGRRTAPAPVTAAGHA